MELKSSPCFCWNVDHSHLLCHETGAAPPHVLHLYLQCQLILELNSVYVLFCETHRLTWDTKDRTRDRCSFSFIFFVFIVLFLYMCLLPYIQISELSTEIKE